MIIENNIDVLNEDLHKLSREKITNSSAQTIGLYYMAKIALENILNKKQISTSETKTDESVAKKTSDFEVAIYTLPNVKEYFANHTENNLKKACLELKEMCLSVYATLSNNNEKNIFLETFKNMTSF